MTDQNPPSGKQSFRCRDCGGTCDPTDNDMHISRDLADAHREKTLE